MHAKKDPGYEVMGHFARLGIITTHQKGKICMRQKFSTQQNEPLFIIKSVLAYIVQKPNNSLCYGIYIENS